MQGWRELARATSAASDELVLRERAGTYEIRCNGWELVSNRAHYSEQSMARITCEKLRVAAPRLLIGGLGMGFTLRAALDHLPAEAEVIVAELLPDIIAWNRGVLAPLAGRPLDDRRVTVERADVADMLRADAFDAILLDVDNGPDAVMLRGNASLYSTEGLRRLRGALRNIRHPRENGDPTAAWVATCTGISEDARNGRCGDGGRCGRPPRGLVRRSVATLRTKPARWRIPLGSHGRSRTRRRR